MEYKHNTILTFSFFVLDEFICLSETPKSSVHNFHSPRLVRMYVHFDREGFEVTSYPAFI